MTALRKSDAASSVPLPQRDVCRIPAPTDPWALHLRAAPTYSASMSHGKRTRQSPTAGTLSPVMIQVDIPASSDLQFELKRTQAALKDAGILIDTAQQPLRIGTKASRRYVLRGKATPRAIQHANEKLHVAVFPDLEVREL